ncbi:MAG: transglutaminase domain-containing protein [Eubacteriales bacterium]
MKKIICLIILLALFLTLAASCSLGGDEDTDPQVRDGFFYYNMLSYKQQQLYEALEKASDALLEESDKVYFTYTSEEWQGVVDAYVADNPTIFFLDVRKCALNQSSMFSKISLAYIGGRDEVSAMREKLSAKLTELSDSLALGGTSTAAQKELAIHDYLVLNTSYDKNNYTLKKDAFNISNTSYGALVDGVALCDGYSYAFKSLCDLAGIECHVVYGVSNSQPHAWNLVKPDEDYYYTDVTWNDPDVDFIDDFVFHGYYNVSYEQITRDHVFDNTAFLPHTGSSNSYFVALDLYADNTESFKRIADREVAKRIEDGTYVFELMTSLSDEEIKQVMLDVIDEINKTAGKTVLLRQFRMINASNVNPACAIQVFTGE